MPTASIKMRKYTISSEEKANVWTHVPGIVFTLSVAAPLIVASCSHGAKWIVGICLFVAGMLWMFTASTLYHLAQEGSRTKRVLRVFDHIAIYAMIAGSYSPVCLGVLGGWIGWSVFGFMQGCVVAGVIGKSIALGRYPRLSLALYLVMGWTALVVIWPLWNALSGWAFWLIVAQGVMYSVGSYFFSRDEQHAYYHATWHVFILLGATCHTIALFLSLS